MYPFFDTIHENRPYSAYKYRFGLQKGIKTQKYFFIFEKYNVSAFYRTFNCLHIFQIGETTPDQLFVSSAR